MQQDIQNVRRFIIGFLCRFPRATRPAAAGYVLTVLADLFEEVDDVPTATLLQTLAVELVKRSTRALDTVESAVLLGDPTAAAEAGSVDRHIVDLAVAFKGAR